MEEGAVVAVVVGSYTRKDGVGECWMLRRVSSAISMLWGGGATGPIGGTMGNGPWASSMPSWPRLRRACECPRYDGVSGVNCGGATYVWRCLKCGVEAQHLPCLPASPCHQPHHGERHNTTRRQHDGDNFSSFFVPVLSLAMLGMSKQDLVGDEGSWHVR